MAAMSSGSAAVETIKKLLESTAPDADQFQEVTHLISSELESTTRTGSLGNPKSERILQWLFEKLKKRDTTEWNAPVLPAALNLLRILILNVSIDVLFIHLQHVDLIDILLQCLQKPQGFQKQSQNSSDREIPDHESELKMINRYDYEAQARLSAICQVVSALQKKVYESQKARRNEATLAGILRCSLKRTVSLIGKALSCLLDANQFTPSKQSIQIQTEIIQPLMFMWNLGLIESATSMEVAQAIAEDCLLPALLLLIEHPIPPLEAFIVDHCLRYFKQEAHVGSENSSKSLSQMFESLVGQAKNKDWRYICIDQLEILYKTLPLLVRLFGRVASKNNTISESWHHKLLLEIMICFNINLNSSANLATDEQILGLANVLAEYRSINVSPKAELLGMILLKNVTSYSSTSWKLVKPALELQHNLVSGDSKEATELLDHLLEIFNKLDADIITQKIKAPDEEHAGVSLVLEPVIEAMLKSHNFVNLLRKWNSCIREALHRIESSSKVLQHVKHRQTCWEIPYIQEMIGLAVQQAVGNNGVEELFASAVDDFMGLSVSKSITESELYTPIVVMLSILEGLKNQDSIKGYIKRLLKEHSSISKRPWATFDLGYQELLLDLLYRLSGLMDPGTSLLREEGADISIADMLTAQLESLLLQDLKHAGEYMYASRAWEFLLELWHRSHNQKQLTPKIRIISSIIKKRLASICKSMISDNTETKLSTASHGWSMSKNSDLIHECISVMQSDAQNYNILDDKELLQFLENIYILSFLRSTRGDDRACLWLELVESCTALEDFRLYQSIRKIQINSLGNKFQLLSLVDEERSSMFYEFCISQLLKLSAHALTTDEQNKLLDSVMDQIEKQVLNKQNSLSSLLLLRKLLQAPMQPVAIVSDPSFIWCLSSCVDNSMSIDDFDLLQSVTHKLSKVWINYGKTDAGVLKTLLSTLKLKANTPLLRESEMAGRGIADSVIATTAATALYWASTEPAEDTLVDGADIASILVKLMKAQFKYWQTAYSELQDEDSHGSLFVILANVATFPVRTYKELMREDQNFHKYFYNLHKNQAIQNEEGSQTNLHQQLDVHEFCLHQLSTIRNKLDGKENEGDSKEFRKQERARILEEFVQKRPHLRVSEIVMLQKLVEVTVPPHERESSLKTAYQAVFNACLEDAELSMTHECGILCNILLFNPWIIVQEHAERVLALVSFLTRPGCYIRISSIPRDAVHEVIAELIELTRIIFQNHRARIGSRWILVIDALKGLLRCFFIPYPNAAVRDIISQPAWLSSGQDSIDAKLVSTFGRLLSNICDPTHESLDIKKKSSHQRHKLNDASKAARAISGQHMQHFIAEFCSLLLRGKMIHREAINPGIYAIFDAMSLDVQRTLSDSLNAPSRVIFKTLYDDWKRFGKWEGN